MNLDEARTKARHIWAAWGGWASQEVELVYPPPRFERRDVTWCLVGVRHHETKNKVVLARGLTFEEAFENAEIALQHRAEKHPRKHEPDPRVLPNMELEL